MKTQKRLSSLALTATMLLMLASMPAFAGDTVVYNNGQPDGMESYTINFGYTVADSFTLTSPANVNHIDFAVFMFPGDTLNTVDWSIFSLGGSANKLWGSGTATVTQEANPYCQPGNFSGCIEEGFTFPAIALPAGTYWLKLGNAVVNDGDPVYWAESGGPSSAYENSIGAIPSESFDVVDPPINRGSVSQPGSMQWFESGISQLTKILSHIVDS